MNTGQSVDVVRPFSATPYLCAENFTDISVSSGQTGDVGISWFINPEKFYVQLLSYKHEFRTMSTEIGRIYRRRVNQAVSCKIGLPVIAKFPLDQNLYRAEIKAVEEHDVFVSFVDYGNASFVGKGELWYIDPVFVTLPKQAILCTLDGVKPALHAWPRAGSSNLDRYFSARTYKCVFKGKDGDSYKVELFLKGESVAEKLVRDGLAITN